MTEQRSFVCPNCHSNRIRASASFISWLLRMVGRKVYRCSLCEKYFSVQCGSVLTNLEFLLSRNSVGAHQVHQSANSGKDI